MRAVTRWDWGLAAGFWSFLAIVYVAQMLWIPQMPGERVNLNAALTWQLANYAAWVPASVAVWRLTAGWLPETARAWRRTICRHLLIFALILVVVSLATTVIAMPGPRSAGAIIEVLGIQIRGRFYLTLIMYIVVAGFGTAMTLQAQNRARQAAAAALQAELATARMRALRNHLEPHFLFNCLHSITSLARLDDTAGVVRLTAGLGEVLRYVLDSDDTPASLHDEFTIVARYLEIQRVRHSDRLAVSLTLAPEAAKARVPVLVIQPLVENALKHGLAPRIQPGTLAVCATLDGGRVRIDVEDDGVGLPEGWTLTATSGTGLRNLVSRLAAECGDQAALEVTARPRGGVRASITLPFVRA